MKHAGEIALDSLEAVLAEIRLHKTLKEKKRGVFYCRSSAFLHFHEDPLGLFADVRTKAGWTRLPVNTPAERQMLLSLIGAQFD